MPTDGLMTADQEIIRYRGAKPDAERYRWMMRAYVEFHLEFCRILMRIFDSDIEKAYIFEAAASLFGDIAFFPAGPDTDVFGPVFTASALAKDLSLPRETVRRKLVGLVEDGFLVKAGPGDFRVPAGITTTPRFRMGTDAIAVQLNAFLNRNLSERFIALERILPTGAVEPVPDADKAWRLVEVPGGDRPYRLRKLFSSYFVAGYRSRMPYFENDLLQAMIFDVVGLFVAEQFYVSTVHREQTASLSVVIGDSQKGATARWVADQTGLPRETVRRKLKRLMEADMLAWTEDGRIVFRVGIFVQRPDIVDGIRMTERLNIELFSKALQDGIFRILPIGQQVSGFLGNTDNK